MIVKLITQTLLWYGVMGLALFVAAGTVHWPAAWFFLAQMIALSLIAGTWLARVDPALVRERLAPPVQKNQPTADKILLSIFLMLFIGWLALMGLDAIRFRWSAVPSWARVLGELVLLLSIWICLRVFRANSFAAPVVKIQGDRGQQVVTTGPYRYIRHPLYAGALTFFVGVSLLLGSRWGLVAAFVLGMMLVVRIQIEEKTLRAGLEGYNEYAERVHYRLIPLVW